MVRKYKDISTLPLTIDEKSLVIGIINDNNLDNREICTDSNIYNFSIKYFKRIVSAKKFIKSIQDNYTDEEIEVIEKIARN
jgi:hypothetical protein